jgi:hypothetical protein
MDTSIGFVNQVQMQSQKAATAVFRERQLHWQRRLFAQDEVPEKINPRRNQDQHLTVHLVPFSNLKVGFKKTVEQYFTGSAGSDWKLDKVALILDSVHRELMRDPKRTFTIA